MLSTAVNDNKLKKKYNHLSIDLWNIQSEIEKELNIWFTKR